MSENNYWIINISSALQPEKTWSLHTCLDVKEDSVNVHGFTPGWNEPGVVYNREIGPSNRITSVVKKQCQKIRFPLRGRRRLSSNFFCAFKKHCQKTRFPLRGRRRLSSNLFCVFQKVWKNLNPLTGRPEALLKYSNPEANSEASKSWRAIKLSLNYGRSSTQQQTWRIGIVSRIHKNVSWSNQNRRPSVDSIP